MEQSDLLCYVVEVFDRLGIRYFVTGSVATVFYGEPRFTNDIDFVVDLQDSKISDFCRSFPGNEFYVSEEAAREAVQAGSQFNIIHPASGLKADVIVSRNSTFDLARFARRAAVPQSSGSKVYFSSPEDVIIRKMVAYLEGGAEKHLRDIAGVVKISGSDLDNEYVCNWAHQLGLTEIWQAILNRTSSCP